MIRSTRLTSSPLIVVALCWSCARGPEPTQKPSVAVEQRSAVHVVETLEGRIPELMTEARIPGLGICVIDDSEISWCGSFGLTDAGTAAPVGRATAFQAASLSKPVFAYTVLRLADRGLIDLDRPLVEYVGLERARERHLGDAFDDSRVEGITARMILTHTSGFPNWRQNRELEFIFDPGERFGYSGEGFGLLQKVVEEITGSSLEELARIETFEPLGMTHTTYTASNIDLADYAWPHDGAGAADPRPDNIEARLAKAKPHAAATLTTTATDYARFLIALVNGDGLEPATSREFLRPQVDVDDGGGVAWGLGTGLERSEDGIRVWHWGDNQDSKAFYIADPATGDGFAFFANSFNGLSIVGALLEIAMPGDHPLLEGALLASYPAHDSPGFAFESAVYADGAGRAIEVVNRLQGEGPSAPVPEQTINTMGYWLLGQERVDEATALFELNVELYPESWNVYDSLGEALLQRGLRDEAFANYRRSLELNPENSGARRVLSEAGAVTP